MLRSLRLRLFAVALACLPLVHAQPVSRDALQVELNRMAGQQARGVLLFFVASDCPISNRYFPEMKRLEAEFMRQGIVTWYVYPNGESADVVRAHQQEFGATQEHVSRDEAGLLTQWTKASTTPESALLMRKGARWSVPYVGRIDNRYLHFGVERQHTTTHDLQRAIQAALADKPVPAADGPPVGCAILPRPAAA